jgi:DNA-binding transcriptional LysR family regulator
MILSLTKLRYLVAIAKAGNFSRAAEDLNVSQPALSRTIAAIEAHYGVTIFERDRLGARLTAPGAQMVAEIEALLRNASNLDRNLHLYGHGEMGRVDIGLGPHIASLFLTAMGKHFMSAKPRFKIRTLIRPPEVLMQELLDNRIDMFISPDYRNAIFPEIEVRRIGSVSTDLIVRAGHPLADRKDLTFGEVAHWPFATPHDAKWPGDPGLFICDNYHIMREIVLDSDLVWFCARQFVKDQLEDGKMVALTIQAPPDFLGATPIFIGRLKGRKASLIENELEQFFEARF